MPRDCTRCGYTLLNNNGETIEALKVSRFVGCKKYYAGAVGYRHERPGYGACQFFPRQKGPTQVDLIRIETLRKEDEARARAWRGESGLYKGRRTNQSSKKGKRIRWKAGSGSVGGQSNERDKEKEEKKPKKEVHESAEVDDGNKRIRHNTMTLLVAFNLGGRGRVDDKAIKLIRGEHDLSEEKLVTPHADIDKIMNMRIWSFSSNDWERLGRTVIGSQDASNGFIFLRVGLEHCEGLGYHMREWEDTNGTDPKLVEGIADALSFPLAAGERLVFVWDHKGGAPEIVIATESDIRASARRLCVAHGRTRIWNLEESCWDAIFDADAALDRVRGGFPIVIMAYAPVGQERVAMPGIGLALEGAERARDGAGRNSGPGLLEIPGDPIEISDDNLPPPGTSKNVNSTSSKRLAEDIIEISDKEAMPPRKLSWRMGTQRMLESEDDVTAAIGSGRDVRALAIHPEPIIWACNKNERQMAESTALWPTVPKDMEAAQANGGPERSHLPHRERARTTHLSKPIPSCSVSEFLEILLEYPEHYRIRALDRDVLSRSSSRCILNTSSIRPLTPHGRRDRHTCADYRPPPASTSTNRRPRTSHARPTPDDSPPPSRSPLLLHVALPAVFRERAPVVTSRHPRVPPAWQLRRHRKTLERVLFNSKTNIRDEDLKKALQFGLGALMSNTKHGKAFEFKPGECRLPTNIGERFWYYHPAHKPNVPTGHVRPDIAMDYLKEKLGPDVEGEWNRICARDWVRPEMLSARKGTLDQW
ncbi:uncharacterized protein BXZ73DRAFT_81406 [Epithele typhae]|uniref:uncharacterized protein n=1 Tax=Epithele typhae TaxID=378194 RepID=UPI002007A0B3|nr:uncharacterized protein BXZ73DRAFT_81406 [Epithele typhae]KAH9915302.1 hypothetical protein BXZ73DRAFT_81406 [Epithele typhae]